MFQEIYTDSWALCIGINNYSNQNQLETAVNDATEIEEILIKDFGFPQENVKVLLDKDATKQNILKEYLTFINITAQDDKLIFFFAGHGNTLNGHHGNTGYLIPQDATNDISTWIRWDEITKSADLIPAKHILFILDACFSGIAFLRSPIYTSSRFMNDMISRFSRQAIASGKANQSVSDGNGPLAGHSIFTGYLIKGLKGDALDPQKIMSANMLMNHVYQKVAHDQNSLQTPHYGTIDGDGDFMFTYPAIIQPEMTESSDIIYEIKGSHSDNENQLQSINNKIKLYLSEAKYRIKFDELVIGEVKNFLQNFNEDNFPQNTDNNEGDYIVKTLNQLEEKLNNLQSILILTAYYGSKESKELTYKIFTRLSDEVINSNLLWPSIRSYSILWLSYSIGISLLIKNDYTALLKYFNINTSPFRENQDSTVLLFTHAFIFASIFEEKWMKKISGHGRYHVPLSEYLLKRLQPSIDDLLFIGNDYENYFDTFEALLSMEFAFKNDSEDSFFWAPAGRFVYKYFGSPYNNNPYSFLVKKIYSGENESEILKAGFFNSDFEKFKIFENKYSEYLKKFNWY